MGARIVRLGSVLPAIVCVAACASAPALRFPVGAGVAWPEFQAAFDAASAGCRGVRTLTAEVAISGRAGGQRLRGRLLAGLASPGSMRLEALAPFGAPLFVMVARESRATLLLTRDDRVVADEPPEAILEALTGVALTPDDVLAVVAGCVSAEIRATAGRSYEGGWQAVDLADATTAYLRSEDGVRRLRGGVRGRLSIEYQAYAGQRPRRIRLRVTGPQPEDTVDLALEVTQADVNAAVGVEAFSLKVPSSAAPLSLEELRRSGPLGGARVP